MADLNFTMPFDTQLTHQRPVRGMPDKYKQSPLGERFPFEQSDGIRPAEYFGVNKYLPVLMKDTTTEDFIVIPKGRIVASTDITLGDDIATFVSQKDSSIKTEKVQTGLIGSYNTYDDDMVGLLTLANGGTAKAIPYTSYDVEAGTFKSKTALATASDTYTNGANKPIGVVFHDWYQDIRGKYLNYRMWPDGGHVLCDYFVQVPYMKVDATATPADISPAVLAGDTAVQYASKFEINKRFTYLTIDAAATGINGSYVTSDLIGNYKLQGTDTHGVQTVGKLIALDSRFPKYGLEDVQTYPGSKMPGTETAGLPLYLYLFVEECLKLNGKAHTTQDIITAVRSGKFGVARIQLAIA